MTESGTSEPSVVAGKDNPNLKCNADKSVALILRKRD